MAHLSPGHSFDQSFDSYNSWKAASNAWLPASVVYGTVCVAFGRKSLANLDANHLNTS